MRTAHELSTVFRAIGLKVTPQRQVLFSLLHNNDTHPSAEAIHLAASAVIPGISLRTVYQTVNDLDGFRVDVTDVVLRGCCSSCATSDDAASPD